MSWVYKRSLEYWILITFKLIYFPILLLCGRVFLLCEIISFVASSTSILISWVVWWSNFGTASICIRVWWFGFSTSYFHYSLSFNFNSSFIHNSFAIRKLGPIHNSFNLKPSMFFYIFECSLLWFYFLYHHIHSFLLCIFIFIFTFYSFSTIILKLQQHSCPQLLNCSLLLGFQSNFYASSSHIAGLTISKKKKLLDYSNSNKEKKSKKKRDKKKREKVREKESGKKRVEKKIEKGKKKYEKNYCCKKRRKKEHHSKFWVASIALLWQALMTTLWIFHLLHLIPFDHNLPWTYHEC